jgi:hypothetical protein
LVQVKVVVDASKRNDGVVGKRRGGWRSCGLWFDQSDKFIPKLAVVKVSQIWTTTSRSL